jgi:hypothetical protein
VSMFIIHLQVSFESNANFWSHDNNWQFQYWQVRSKLNTTKWTSKFYWPIFNENSIKFFYNKLWISYWFSYGKMHPLNNACQELLKLIGLIINEYILHSNSQITSHYTIT